MIPAARIVGVGPQQALDERQLLLLVAVINEK